MVKENANDTILNRVTAQMVDLSEDDWSDMRRRLIAPSDSPEFNAMVDEFVKFCDDEDISKEFISDFVRNHSKANLWIQMFAVMIFVSRFKAYDHGAFDGIFSDGLTSSDERIREDAVFFLEDIQRWLPGEDWSFLSGLLRSAESRNGSS